MLHRYPAADTMLYSTAVLMTVHLSIVLNLVPEPWIHTSIGAEIVSIRIGCSSLLMLLMMSKIILI